MALAYAATKIPQPVLEQVRKFAHLESLRTGREITASQLIRRAVERLVQELEGNT